VQVSMVERLPPLMGRRILGGPIMKLVVIESSRSSVHYDKLNHKSGPSQVAGAR
jgi:hypothetical protein